MNASDHTPAGRLAARLEAHTAIRVARCYQCGKCSAGCPMAGEMDQPPSRLLRLVQTGDERHERTALGSRALWLCVGCETCVSRCPNDVDLPRVIDFLREQALAEGLAHPETKAILAFHRAFLATLGRHGRLYELELIARYKLATGRLLQDVALAPAMIAKGKIGLLPHRSGRAGTVARLAARAAAVTSRIGAARAADNSERRA